MGGENLNKSTSDAGEAWSNMAASVETEKNVAEKRAEVTEKAKKNSTLKKFVLGAVFALGVMTMVGCGKDGDASAVSEPTPSVSIEYNTPTPSYEINDDDEDGNSAYNPGEITVIDGEQDGGDGNDNVDVEPGGDGGEVEAGVDNIWESEYWDGDTFHLDEYAIGELGYEELTRTSLFKGLPGIGYLEVSNMGCKITCYDTDNQEIWSLVATGEGSGETVPTEFMNRVGGADRDSVTDLCSCYSFCSNIENAKTILNGNIPEGWRLSK